MYHTYVLKSKKTGTWYIGYTGNIRKRLWEHNNGKSSYTRSGGPWELIYNETCNNEEDARSREIYLKTGMGRRYLKNRLKRFLSLTGL